MTTAALIKGSIESGLAYSSEVTAVSACLGTWQHTGRSVLERELRVVHLSGSTGRERDTGPKSP